MPYKLTTFPMNTKITLRLIQQSTFSFGYPDKLVFLILVLRNLLVPVFSTWAKNISELILLKWHDIAFLTLKNKRRKASPLFMSLYIVNPLLLTKTYLHPHLHRAIGPVGRIFSPW